MLKSTIQTDQMKSTSTQAMDATTGAAGDGSREEPEEGLGIWISEGGPRY
jgi:hypothetical protein